MSQITAKMVADLRAATGLGMMECKKALVEAEGDAEKAEELLRIKSGAKAGKLAGRTAAEGIIANDLEGHVGALVEINCETDFVAKDNSLNEFGKEVAKAVVKANPKDLEDLNNAKISTGITVEERRKEIIAKLGENISIRRFVRTETTNNLAIYMHGTKIGVLVEYQGDETVAKDIAMHIAASKPQCLSSEQVDPAVIEKERHIYTEQVADSGKPPEILTKMIEGKIKKFLSEVTLLGQQFVKNPDLTVEKLLAQHKSKVISFSALHVGEGIEKKTVDYAAEVAAASRV